GKPTLPKQTDTRARESPPPSPNPRRYAGYLDATTEFTKMEGQAHNAADKKLYTVISYIRTAMIDGENKDRPRDDIRLSGDPKDLVCGAVYESSMTGGRKATSGDTIISGVGVSYMDA